MGIAELGTHRVLGNWGRSVRGLAAVALLVTAPLAGAEALPQISIVIDDLGEQRDAGWRALQLPGKLAYAFLPNTRYAEEQARAAHHTGKEVLLHLPLQAQTGRLYETGISEHSSRDDVIQQLRAGLASVPHVRGVNNHQGSLLTERVLHMDWLMSALRDLGGYYFLDSRTTASSVAYATARSYGLPSTTRNIFLDTRQDAAFVAEQFHKLIRLAHRNGQALAIGHPYPETLRVLERELRQLPAHGVQLVWPSELIHRRQPQYRVQTTLRPSQSQSFTSSLRLSTRPTLPQPRTAK